MKNFARVLRYAWNYRSRLVVSLFCAMLAAALWGLMFACVDPVLSILRTGDNLQSRQERRIEETETVIAGLEPRIEVLSREARELDDKGLPEAVRQKRRRELAVDLAKLESKLEDARSSLRWLLLAKKYIDRFMPTDAFLTLAWLFLLVIAAVALRGIFEFSQESLVGSVVNRSLYDLRNEFYRRVIRLDLNQFGEHGTSELMARFTNDTELVGAGLKTLFGRVVGEPLKAFACILFASWISWQLTLLFLVLVPIAVFTLTRVGRMMKRATRRLLERMSSIYKILQETFLGIRVVKAYTMEPYERRRFKEATRDYYKKAMMVVRLEALAGPVVEVLGVMAVAAALLAGAYLVLQRQTHLFGMRMTAQPLEAEQLLQLYAYLAAIADPVRKLSSVYTRMQSGYAASDRVFDFMDRKARVQCNAEGRNFETVRQAIEFRDVCFSYEPGKPILTNIHLHIRAGETIAFVGKNGCGKTTLLGLLPRFFDPDHGAVLIDGQDIRKLNLRRLRKHIGLVTQDSVLFEDTIFANIAYGKRNATQEEVEDAARKANAHDFIMSLRQGYQTRLNESTWKPSGGQKQRIALARAILRDPAILILDEFTSQNDTEAEADIHRALRDFKRGRTTLVITHRLHTLEIADRIVVMDEQRIVAVGTHPELLATCPAYQRLHDAHTHRLCA